MTTYSACLFSTSVDPDGTSTSDPVPTGYIWVVRDIMAYNPGRQMTTAFLENTSDGNLNIIFVSKRPGYFGESLHWKGRQVLNAGDQISFTADNVSGWEFYVSGYVLSTS